MTSGYDFFGGHAVYVEGFARDPTCANSLRALTDREVVRGVRRFHLTAGSLESDLRFGLSHNSPRRR